MTVQTTGRCGNHLTWTITDTHHICALPAGHNGWHQAEDGTEWSRNDKHVPLFLAAIDNALRNGSHMTGANLAFELLCGHLGVDRNQLVFQPGWATTVTAAERG